MTSIGGDFGPFMIVATAMGPVSTININDTTINIVVPFVADLLMACPAGLEPPFASFILTDISL